MAVKRKITDYFDTKPQPLFPIFSMPQAKKRAMKSHAERGQIEDIFVRFPHLSEEIFGLLDYKTIASCNEVNRNWFETLNNQRGYLEIFKQIFDKIEAKNPRNQDGITPLHNAAKHGHLEICKLICQSIGNKNPADNRGETPIDMALASSVKNKLRSPL